MMTLAPGHLIRHFCVSALDGRSFDYSTVWQRHHLLLIAVRDPEGEEARHYLAALASSADELTACDTVTVVTRETIEGLEAPAAIVVADRWGEVQFVSTAVTASGLPAPTVVVGWVRSVDQQCPECQGEAR